MVTPEEEWAQTQRNIGGMPEDMIKKEMEYRKKRREGAPSVPEVPVEPPKPKPTRFIVHFKALGDIEPDTHACVAVKGTKVTLELDCVHNPIFSEETYKKLRKESQKKGKTGEMLF
jgi:hypothetical protein